MTSIPEILHAAAVLFPGSGGVIQLRNENGNIRFSTGNFLVRSRSGFIKPNVVAAILDAPSDQQGNWGMTDEFRRGELYFTDISTVIAGLAKRFQGIPLFLVGTSRGAVSAEALRSRFGNMVEGVVITATMFQPAGRNSNEPGHGLSDFDFASIKAPVLFVQHVGDQCEVTPYSNAARFADRYPLVSVFGGEVPQSGRCDAYGQHGFFGKEADTV